MLYSELNIHGIIAHGYWEEFTGDAAEVLAEACYATEFEPPRRRSGLTG